ncbi:hypothetical protein ACGGZK_02270 [Agromyces sp. MMS24-K17]|uniref:hypothetical protein n=1 Tax=Agromyces sp. MMS24-K17 TaxID=3372850 RepID=UPI0037549BF6
MTEARPSIDPRYDARFQRGYVESHQREADAPARAVPEPASKPASNAAAPKRAATGAADAGAPAEAPLLVADATAPASAPPADADGPAFDALLATLDDGAAASSDPAPPPPDPERRVATRWLWIVLGVSIVSMLLGLVFAVQLAFSPGRYTGLGREDVEAQMLLSALVPPLVQVGAIGIVAALLGWALFAGRRGARP